MRFYCYRPKDSAAIVMRSYTTDGYAEAQQSKYVEPDTVSAFEAGGNDAAWKIARERLGPK